MGECTVVLVGGNNGGKEHLLQELLGRRQGGAWCYSYRHITYDLRLLPLCALQSPALRGADCTVLVTPALDLQRAARGIFGYLDHPFSERYQYGWESKEQRLGAHHKLVEAIRARPDVWFWNQRQCFDFVKALMRVTLVTDDTGSVTVRGAEPSEAFRMEYRYRGALFTI